MSETAFINSLKSLVSSDNALGLEDDVCIISETDKGTIISSQDSICEDIHFFSNDPIDMVIKKAIRTNISDIACKGAKPYGMLLSLCLPKRYHSPEAQELIHTALKEDLEFYNLSLLGGDTTASKKLVITITIFGLCQHPIPFRKNVQLGDKIYVTGTLGLSKIGLDLRLGKSLTEYDPIFEQAYLLPSPPLNTGIALAPYMQASMDISDGLLGDLQKMIDVNHSNLGFELDYTKIPCADIDNEEYALECALSGGDDYQILFTSQHKEEELHKIAKINNTTLSCIGNINNNKNSNNYSNFSHL